MKRFLLFMLISGLVWNCAQRKTVVKPIPSENEQMSQTIQDNGESRFLKRMVAIARFSNETKYGKGIFYDGENDPLAKQAMDILSSKLAETGKFILLERSDIDAINNELNLGGLEKLNIPAEYLIIGSVSEFGRNTTSDVGIFARKKTQTARAKVNIRLVEISTGQVIYSEEGEEDATVMGVGSRAGYNSILNDKAISSAISKLVSNLVSNLTEKPWKSYIVDFSENNYIISGGETQGIRSGDVFLVLARGKKIKNPQTNMMLELPGKEIGKLEVISTLGDLPQNEVSVCIKTEGDIPVDNFENLIVQEIK